MRARQPTAPGNASRRKGRWPGSRSGLERVAMRVSSGGVIQVRRAQDVIWGVYDGAFESCRINADCNIGFAAGLAVAFWRHHTCCDDVLALEAATIGAHEGCGRRVALIQVVSATAIVPDEPARAALAAFLRRSGRIVARSAIVHEAQGFRAAMIRSIVTGIAALSNPGFPHRVYGCVPDATDWLCQPGDPLAAPRAREVVERVRLAHSAEPPARGRRNAPVRGELHLER